MLQCVKALIDERVKDCLAVVIPNGAAIALINLVRLNQVVTLAVGVVTIAYALWRWRRDSYVLCNGCRDGRPPAICPYSPEKRPCWCPKRL